MEDLILMYGILGQEKIDAFSQFMGNDMNHLILPPSLITKTLNQLRQDKAKEILIISVWNLTGYSPIIQKNCIFYEFIKDIYYLSKKDYIFTGAGKNGVLLIIHWNLEWSPLELYFYLVILFCRNNHETERWKGSDLQWCFFCTTFIQFIWKDDRICIGLWKYEH